MNLIDKVHKTPLSLLPHIDLFLLNFTASMVCWPNRSSDVGALDQVRDQYDEGRSLISKDGFFSGQSWL